MLVNDITDCFGVIDDARNLIDFVENRKKPPAEAGG
jgi:hypothetical protein